MRVLVTGATGFIGTWLSKRLVAEGHSVRGSVHRSQRIPAGVEPVYVGEIGPLTDWRLAVAGVDVVVHLAGLAHTKAGARHLSEYLAVNAAGTERLARAAVSAGVRRFVFASSIRVNGDDDHGRAFAASDPAAPIDAYGISKLQAEEEIRAISAERGIEIVIVRPPLVYGPGVRANFLRLLQFVDRGIPLPLGSIRNKRSLVYVGNLADLLVCCSVHHAAAGRTLLVSDGEDLSTPQLVRSLARHLERPAKLLPCPPSLLVMAGIATGQSATVRRLIDTLRVDISQTMRLLDWRPAASFDHGIAETVAWYRAMGSAKGGAAQIELRPR